MNFILIFIQSFIVSVAFFVLFVSTIGPIIAKTFNWHGNDPTALFGPEWIWNWGFFLTIVLFFIVALFIERLR
jgi:hypothetical protein